MSDDVHKFWDLYEESGAKVAVDFAREVTNGEGDLMAHAIPSLVLEAKARKIDMIKFLEELDAVEQEDAARADNDARGIPADVNSEDHKSADADESASARDADGQDRSEDEGGLGSEDV